MVDKVCFATFQLQLFGELCLAGIETVKVTLNYQKYFVVPNLQQLVSQ